MKILNFGSLNLDHSYRMKHFVKPGETTRARDYQIFYGGKGHNQSVALAKAGLECWHAGLIGQDGRAMLDAMQGLGINTDFCKQVEGPSGHTIIQVDSQGENSIIFYPGANFMVDEAFIEQVFAGIPEDCKYLVLQNEISHNTLIMEQAKARGLKIILNPSPLNEEILACPLDLVDLFIVNETEGLALAGLDHDQINYDLKSKDTSEFAKTIHSKIKEAYPQADVLLTLGKDGAYFSCHNDLYYQEVFPVEVVDTTAAGDSFTGYFLATWLKGQEDPTEDKSYIQEALKRASRAASLAITRPGAADSIPDKSEVQAHLE